MKHSGSHKAEFDKPGSLDIDGTRGLMQSYACPPGSLLVFTESLLHATAEWTHPTRERIAIFTHYCNIYSQFHRLLLPHEAIVTVHHFSIISGLLNKKMQNLPLIF